MTQTAFLNPSHAVVSSHAGAVAGERFLVLDSWRGICALLVALFHFPTGSMISQSAFVGSSYLFVDFFFVLSGFVLASGYLRTLNRPAGPGRSLRTGPFRSAGFSMIPLQGRGTNWPGAVRYWPGPCRDHYLTLR